MEIQPTWTTKGNVDNEAISGMEKSEQNSSRY